MKAIILLAINGGIGGKDIAGITVDKMGAKTGEWLDLPRLKTGAQRRVWLWPETIEAIEAYRPYRKYAKNSESSDVFFLTKFGRPWIRSNVENAPDMINQNFTRLRDKHCPDRTFYDLRRTFRTIAAETLDIEATQLVMGHSEEQNDMGFVYNQRITDERIKAVCAHVRKWLFG